MALFVYLVFRHVFAVPAVAGVSGGQRDGICGSDLSRPMDKQACWVM